MSSIPSKGTKPELLLRKALWSQKLRYRVNYKKLPGKPDIVFTKYQIAVFCDGDFWHGHNWVIRGLNSLEEELEGYSDFWRQKILRNIERDNEVNSRLHSLGWTVVRFWESEIYADLDGCVKTVREMVFDAKMNMDE
ncbi:MAG: very short patch repair endonuclease [Enterocloster citroniae]|nr:very short patch repair endonuclease [Enterocloster citroniae]